MRAGQNFIPAKTKATMGLALIKEAILDHLEAHRDGLRNAELAHGLGLESDHAGQQRGYLISVTKSRGRPMASPPRPLSPRPR
jgi:hypothetical protein